MPDETSIPPSELDPASEPSPEALHGLDPGELLARGLQTAKLSGGRDAWEPPTPEELNRLLPQYNIESLIGRGGMGAVYKGTQVILDRPVAIKLLPAEIAADEQFVIRFHREARTLARLQHSRIITIHDFGQTSEGHLYFVMEYIDGTNLREILRGPGLNPEQALLVTAQICDALQTAHAQGVIHRDIKPENILVTQDGYVKLADFGLSRPMPSEDVTALTGTNIIMGTADYMAPEQREGRVDQRADIFALGVMLYEMLTGKPPRGAFEPASSRMRGMQLDVRIDQVVLKALQAEPVRRYQHVSDMKTDVDRIRNTPLPTPASAAPPPAATPARQRSRALLIACPIVALLLCIAVYFIFFQGRNSPLIPTGPNAKSSAPRDLKAPTASLAANANSGYTALLDREHADGWKHLGPGRMLLEDGTATTVSHQGWGCFWYTKRTFSDFVLKLEYKTIEPTSNSGVFVRLPSLDGATVEMCGRAYEVQIYGNAGKDQPTGSICDFQRPFAETQKPQGEWNEMEITAVGQKYTIKLNGRLVNEFFGHRGTSGYIGLQTHPAGVVEIRNVLIKDLANASAAENRPLASPSPQAKALPTAARQIALSSTRGTVAENEALTKALLSHPWSWNAMAPETFPWKEIVFRSDDTVATSTTATGRWTITGPHSATLQFSQADRLLLTFYSGSDYFTGCREDGKIIVSGQSKSWQAPSSTTASEPDSRYSGEHSPAPNQPSTPAPSSLPRANYDHEALTRALLSHPWSWNAMAPETFPWKEIVFRSDGTVTTSTTATGRWTITGPHSATLQFSPADRLLLTFYSGSDYFTGCREDGKIIVSGQLKSWQTPSSTTASSTPAPAKTANAAPPPVPAAAAQASPSPATDAGFTRGPEASLFNGRDLTGWDGRRGYWSVQNGAITGKITAANLSSGNTFLVWQGGEPSDFELTCKYRLVANNPEGFANSGIQFRARYSNRERFELKGYQGEMDPGTNHPNDWISMPNMNGCLTDDGPGILLAPTGQKVVIHPGEVAKRLGKFDVIGSLGTSQSSADSFRKYDWNDYRIVAFRNHIQIFVNGLQTVDAIDEGNRFTSGLIGLQLHGLNKAKTLQFKDLYLRELRGSLVVSRGGMGRPPTTVNPPAAPLSPAAKQTFGSYQEEAVLGHHWSWDTVAGNGSPQTIQFLQDGTVSGGWHWQWLPKPGGELVVDCFWDQGQHLFLKFDKQFSEFEAYGEQGGCQVRGKRLAPIGGTGESR